MLSQRQQHCLRGIGIRLWQDRDNLALDTNVQEAPADAMAPQESLTAAPPPAPATMETLEAPASEPPRVPLETATPAPETAEPPAARPIGALDSWDDIHNEIEACQACALSQNCTRKVPGIGDREADLMIVGEGPGHDEDLRGEPFVGRSGQLLDRMLEAIGFARDQVYITNIVKCRPPNNRDPKPEEAQQCRAYLEAQIREVKPKVILSVGRVSAHNLLGCHDPVGKLIKQMHQLPDTDIPLKVTYHPAYLLRNPPAKAIAWQDMKLLHRMLK